jgi:hypothetical protein
VFCLALSTRNEKPLSGGYFQLVEREGRLNMHRRDFMKTSALAVANGIFLPQSSFGQLATSKRIGVRLLAQESIKTRLAVNELCSGLRMLNAAWELRETADDEPNSLQFTLSIEDAAFKGAEDYEISVVAGGIRLRAVNEQALLYAVFDFLERQGTVFGIDGTLAPIEVIRGLHLPPVGSSWAATPEFTTRGLLPWPDFLNCISVYNDEDYKAYFAAILRMRINMFGMHVYTQNPPLAESYLSFDFAGSGHTAALEDSTMTSWGYLPQRTSTYKMGAAEFFDRETFGSDATRLAADNWDRADRTTTMFRKALAFAQQIGIRTGIGFEPYINPAETLSALPPESKSFPGGLVESRIGKDLLERRLADLLERYPMVDYVWLWQDEDSNWDSRKKEVSLSVTPFVQAHEFLKKHAPTKQLVLGGWGASHATLRVCTSVYLKTSSSPLSMTPSVGILSGSPSASSDHANAGLSHGLKTIHRCGFRNSVQAICRPPWSARAPSAVREWHVSIGATGLPIQRQRTLPVLRGTKTSLRLRTIAIIATRRLLETVPRNSPRSSKTPTVTTLSRQPSWRSMTRRALPGLTPSQRISTKPLRTTMSSQSSPCSTDRESLPSNLLS